MSRPSKNPKIDKAKPTLGENSSTEVKPAAMDMDKSQESQPQPNMVKIKDVTEKCTGIEITARVIAKLPLRKYKSAHTEEGQVINVDLRDGSGTIRAAAFGTMAKKLETELQVGLAYRIGGVSVRPADPKYSSSGHQFDILLNDRSTFAVVSESGLPQFVPVYTKLGAITAEMIDTKVNILAVLKESGMVQVADLHSGKSVEKLALVVTDQSTPVMNLTLWGPLAQSFAGTVGQVCGFMQLSVSSYGGLSLSSTFNSSVLIEPQGEDAAVLRDWAKRTK